MQKRGDYHPDGSGRRLLGFQYRKTKDGLKEKKEWWVSQKKYEDRLEKIRIKNLNWRKNNREHYRQYKRELNQKNPEKNRARARKWALNNPEKVRQNLKRAYLKNPDKFKARSYKWRNENRGKHLESRKKWREKRGDIENERTRKWRIENPEKVKASARKSYYENADYRASRKAYAAKRKASLKDAFFKLSAEEQKRLMRVYKMAELISEHTGVNHHVDHWQPLSRGGKHHPDNLVIVKADENLKKRAIPVEKLSPLFFTCIHLPKGFFQMDWIWRGGRKPRGLKVKEDINDIAQSPTNPQ